MEDIVFPKRYRSKETGAIVEFYSKIKGRVIKTGTESGTYIGELSDDWIDCTIGTYWEPVEEEYTVPEKEPFPAFEDIEWVMVEAPKGVTSINGMTLLEEKLDCSNGAYRAEVEVARILHENSKDFKVSWQRKDKIDRRLHCNMPLARAIGRAMVEGVIFGKGIKLVDGSWLQGVAAISEEYIGFVINKGKGIERKWFDEATLPEDYIFPEQVLQWMKEYKGNCNG